MTPPKKPDEGSKKPTRSERLKQALRRNIRRRKAVPAGKTEGK
jgi:hypothetical protein